MLNWTNLIEEMQHKKSHSFIFCPSLCFISFETIKAQKKKSLGMQIRKNAFHINMDRDTMNLLFNLCNLSAFLLSTNKFPLLFDDNSIKISKFVDG